MLSTAMQKALRFMAKRGGEGIIDNRGWVMCAGERGPYEAATWLRLVSEGLVGPAGSQRLALTGAGVREASKVPDSQTPEKSVRGRCQKWLMASGSPYPRTCQECGLGGPCHFGAWDWSNQAEIDGGRT